MKNKRFEENIIIGISSMKQIMSLFLGPFLTAYFIKKSTESIMDISIYYILSYILLAVLSFGVTRIIKRKFRIGMFRIGVILSFLYIVTIVFLKEKILDYLWLVAILSGISSSTYWLPYNLFSANKIDNERRNDYTVKAKLISSIIGIVCPILLGAYITITNYELTAIIVLFISFIQIILSFNLSKDEDKSLSKYDAKKVSKKLVKNKQIRKMLLVEFFIGMNVSDGALQILMTILIFNSFKTNLNLGIITSLTTILSMLVVKSYGKVYKNKSDNKIIIISSILPVISVFLLLICKNSITIIAYNILYVIFTSLLSLIREVRLFNISNSDLVTKDDQCEFFAIREAVLNYGRIISYSLLFFAGFTGSELILNIAMVLLTISIVFTGVNLIKVKNIIN